ncbi:hypothetical protein KR093_009096, partial [Drosophila rubida]
TDLKNLNSRVSKLLCLSVKRKAIVEFTRMDVNNRLPNLLKVNYSISRTARNTSVIFANFTVTEDIAHITGVLNMKIKHTDKFMNYFTLDMDYCKLMQTLYSQYVLKMIVDQIRAVSNYPLDCPIKKNQEYYVKGFTFNTDLLPSYFPGVSFLVNA